MLFLNRRGYAPLTLCRTCGHRMQCPNCTAWLVEHRFQGLLRCHHCDHAEPIPSNCPQCDNTGSFAACGPGIERISDEVGELFPEARVIAAGERHVPGLRQPGHGLQEAIRQVRDHEIDIVIGTQIIAKGHHFPMLTLVGVVDADLGLTGGDLRASERTYQLLHQVAGRAGRAERPGRVLLQTYMPEHRVMQALADDQRDSFLAVEAESERNGVPPPCRPIARLAALIVSGPDTAEVGQVARTLAPCRAAVTDGVVVLGPGAGAAGDAARPSPRKAVAQERGATCMCRQLMVGLARQPGRRCRQRPCGYRSISTPTASFRPSFRLGKPGMDQETSAPPSPGPIRPCSMPPTSSRPRSICSARCRDGRIADRAGCMCLLLGATLTKVEPGEISAGADARRAASGP